MPSFTVQRAIEIKAPKVKIHDILRNFRQWEPWSPWLSAEPDCDVDYAEDGNSYTWDGHIIGSGKLTLSRDQPHQLDYNLQFFKPWKSESSTFFELVEHKDSTKVTWGMSGTLPFFLFWMKKMMRAWIGMDYERGLAKLKDYAESDTVPSLLEFPGLATQEGCSYVGIRSTCSFENVGLSMTRDFKRLLEWKESNQLTGNAPPFSIMHKWDMIKRTTENTVAVPVNSLSAALPEGFVSGTRPAVRAFQIVHTGAYRHLGSAWSAGMMRMRNKVFRSEKSIDPFEIYHNDPGTTPEADLRTTIHFPCR